MRTTSLAFTTLVCLFMSCGSEQDQVVAIENASTQVEQQEPIAQRLALDEWAKNLSDKPGLILDVRTADEVARGKIGGAVNVDFLGDDFVKGVEEFDRSKPVHVYCAAGGRSKKAMKQLSELGFTEVYDLKGGFNGWFGAGKPVEKP